MVFAMIPRITFNYLFAEFYHVVDPCIYESAISSGELQVAEVLQIGMNFPAFFLMAYFQDGIGVMQPSKSGIYDFFVFDPTELDKL